MPSTQLNKIFILFNWVCDRNTSFLSNKIEKTSQTNVKSNRKRMIDMNTIPYKRKTVHQNCRICELNCTALPGMPSFGGACVQIIPEDAARLGLPHRYCTPESDAGRPVQKVLQPDELESDIV